jgi:uncharacterized protein involved in oxidation of intracellular sulfur
MKFLWVLSKGFEKSGSATRAIQLAALAAEKGAEVEVFLIDDAIHWAQLGMAEGIRSSTGEHMKELLDKMVSRNCPVYVCKACADKRLVDEDDLIGTAEIQGAGVLTEKMIDPDYKVFVF